MPLGPSIKISCFPNMVLELRLFFSGTATRPPDRVLPLDLPIQSCSRCCPSSLMVDSAPSCYSMPQSTSTCCVCAPLLICRCMSPRPAGQRPDLAPAAGAAARLRWTRTGAAARDGQGHPLIQPGAAAHVDLFGVGNASARSGCPCMAGQSVKSDGSCIQIGLGFIHFDWIFVPCMPLSRRQT